MVARDIILAVAVLGVMAFGFFVIKRLDKFLDENRKRIEHKEKEMDKKSRCLMLTTDRTDEELINIIRAYEKQHGDAHITLYQNENELYEELFDGKR